MLRLILFSIVFFLLIRYINRLFLPSRKQNKSFNPFYTKSSRRKNNFDDIEEAEYEDLSNKDH